MRSSFGSNNSTSSVGMKSAICLIALIMGVASMAVQAAENDHAPALIYVGAIGVSNGGDTLYSAYDDAGWRSNLRAGAFLQLGVGVLLQPPASPVTLQLTFNWQNDAFNYNYFYKSNVSNGFNRFPIELMGYYTPIPDFRIGVGKRFRSEERRVGKECRSRWSPYH